MTGADNDLATASRKLAASVDGVTGASSARAIVSWCGRRSSSGGEYGPGGPTFVFTGLNGIKPKMIADATERAREAPGVNAEGQIAKVVRAVATVEYALR